MNKQVIYIHGGASYSNYENYLNDLKTKPIRYPHGNQPDFWPTKLPATLGDDFEVFRPQMPNKNNATYNEWKIWFERFFEFITTDVVLVGWSQGGYFLAKYLVENDPPINVTKLFLLAAPIGPDDFGGEDGGDFKFNQSHLSQITDKVGKIHILHSKDDFVVPYEHALQYKEALPEAELITFEDKNHFLVEELPELIDLIKQAAT